MHHNAYCCSCCQSTEGGVSTCCAIRHLAFSDERCQSQLASGLIVEQALPVSLQDRCVAKGAYMCLPLHARILDVTCSAADEARAITMLQSILC